VPPDTELATFIGGFVAAEGTFVRVGTPPRFRFAVALGAKDAATCSVLHKTFGAGTLSLWPRRKVHYQDEITFAIQSLRDHLAVTIPFMDQHLPESHKRQQYLVWRAELLDHWEHRAKRVRACTVEGCEEPRRARGVCRRHLYAHHGV
jgi:hypothetical protein